VKKDDGAVREAGIAARVVHQHQREQAGDLGLVRHQLGERAAEPDRLCGKVAPAAVALVEDEVDDREHCAQAIGQEMRGRDAERDARRLDFSLRAHESLRHRLLGNEERTSNFLRPQPAERPQRQRDLRVELERGMAAGEDELEALVRDRRLVHHVLHRFRDVEQAGLLGKRAVAADAVDRAVARCGHEPRTRARRGPVARPAVGSDRERLLGGFLGEIEVAEEADQRGEHAAPLVAKDLVELYHSATGRTSTAPPIRAAGTREASSIAASRSSAS